MNKIILFFLGLIVFSSQAQVATNKYYIQFTDKNNSPYSIDAPEAFLSDKAIQRRAKYNIDITLRDLPVNPQYLQGVQNLGAQLLNPTKWLNGVTVFTTDPSVIDAIEQLPYVASVTRSVDVAEEFVDEKELFKYGKVGQDVSLTRSQANFNYGSGLTQISQVNGVALHNEGFTGKNVIIAVLDTGFDRVDEFDAFDSLRANDQILATYDFVNPGGNVYAEHHHGRAVLSTMGANLPGLLVGTAPHADYLLLRSEDAASENIIEEYNWVSAAEFADSAGADVINSSLGYIGFDNPSFDHSYEDMDGNTNIVTIGADLAAARGIIVVNSAGNSGDILNFPWIGAPADGDSVFSIGAVDGSGTRAYFSSIGPTADGRTKPNIMAMGQGTAVINGFGEVTSGNGTSFSSPIVAGMMACLLQSNPTYNNQQLMDAVMQTASRANNPDSEMGYGIPDFYLASTVVTLSEENISSNEPLFEVYPNPFNDFLSIELHSESSDIVAIELMNVSGQRIFFQSLNLKNGDSQLEFEGIVDNLPSGLYMLRISTDKKYQVEKLMKR